ILPGRFPAAGRHYVGCPCDAHGLSLPFPSWQPVPAHRSPGTWIRNRAAGDERSRWLLGATGDGGRDVALGRLNGHSQEPLGLDVAHVRLRHADRGLVGYPRSRGGRVALYLSAVLIPFLHGRRL